MSVLRPVLFLAPPLPTLLMTSQVGSNMLLLNVADFLRAVWIRHGGPQHSNSATEDFFTITAFFQIQTLKIIYCSLLYNIGALSL